MNPPLEAYLQLAAQLSETLVWFVLTVVCLNRAHRERRFGPAALGGLLLFVPATTIAAAQAQLVWGRSSTIYENYLAGPLPSVYPWLKVTGAVLLLVALGLLATRRARPEAAQPV